MTLFKPYTNIKDFLHRYTLFKIGKLHIRFHKIVDNDQSTLYHNHPFHYISIILKGGYRETILIDGTEKFKTHKFLSVICRKNSIYHRIDQIFGETITFFIAYGNYGWKAINTVQSNDDGLYQREINGINLWSKKEAGIWFIGHVDKTNAIKETRHSIHQIIRQC